MSTAQELFDEANSLRGHERLEMLGRAADAADAEQDLDLAFTSRMALVRSSLNYADGLQVVSAYGWCLTRNNEDPERFPVPLWYYKWVANHVLNFASVSKKQFDALIDDMEQRFAAQGVSLSPVLEYRMWSSLHFDDLAVAEEAFERWRTSDRQSRKGLNDCRACTLATEANALRDFGRHDEALEVAMPVLQGELGCSSQPHYALAKALESARHCGRMTDAHDYHIRGLDLIAHKADFFSAYGFHFRHMAVTGKLDQASELNTALDLMERTITNVYGDDGDRFDYYRGARLLLRAITQHDPGSERAAKLRIEVGDQAEQVAAAFDTRNGTTRTSELLAADDHELAARS